MPILDYYEDNEMSYTSRMDDEDSDEEFNVKFAESFNEKYFDELFDVYGIIEEYQEDRFLSYLTFNSICDFFENMKNYEKRDFYDVLKFYNVYKDNIYDVYYSINKSPLFKNTKNDFENWIHFCYDYSSSSINFRTLS